VSYTREKKVQLSFDRVSDTCNNLGVGHPHKLHTTMSRLTLTIDSSLAQALRDEAKRDDRPISSVARKAFAAYFGTPPAPKRTRKTRA
jgi:hypothetical protein